MTFCLLSRISTKSVNSGSTDISLSLKMGQVFQWYSLTYGWAGRKRLTCCHPNHSGKLNLQKMPRRINIEMSRSIYILENQTVPIGAGMKN